METLTSEIVRSMVKRSCEELKEVVVRDGGEIDEGIVEA